MKQWTINVLAVALIIAIAVPSLALGQTSEYGGPLSSSDFGSGGASGGTGGLSDILGGGGGGVGGLEVPVADQLVRAKTGGILTQTTSLNRKDTVYDGIAYAVAKIMLRQVTASIVDWINSGFKGNPAFVQDFGGFLSDTADQVLGSYLYGSNLAFLCSPFSLQVRISLAFSRTNRRQAQCKLSSIVKNLEGFFYDSNVRLTTLEQWDTVSSDPFGNPYSAHFTEQSNLNADISLAQYQNTFSLNLGRGFLDFKVCDVSQNSTNSLTDSQRGCRTTTPGAVIEQQLENTLGSGIRQLELADEFNEIVSALMGQIAQQALTAAGGLFGLSTPRSGSSSSAFVYTNGLRGTTSDPAFTASRSAAQNQVATSQSTTIAYQNLILDGLGALDRSKGLVNEVSACYAGKLQRGGLDDANVAVATNHIASASTTVATSITPDETKYRTASNVISNDITALAQISSSIAGATTPQELSTVMNQYESLVSSKQIPDDTDLLSAQGFLGDLQQRLTTLDQTTISQLSECQQFPVISF